MTQQTAEDRPGIAAAIVVWNGRVLLVRRRVREGELSWQFPAGEIEPGESAEAGDRPGRHREQAPRPTGPSQDRSVHGVRGVRR
jgi:8-oxo-dGTP diphosphatase